MTSYALLTIAGMMAGATFATFIWALLHSSHSSQDQNIMSYEQTIQDWAISRFGVEVATDPIERAKRLLEEAIELAQSENVPREFAHKLLDYVYDKPVGDCLQEAAGTGVALYGYAAAKNVRVDDLVDGEIARILSLPPEHFRTRHNAKAAAGIALEAK